MTIKALFYHPALLILIFILVILQMPLFSESPTSNNRLKLQDYGPNTIVVRKDNNDDYNIGFTVSQMFPIYHDGGSESQTDWGIYPFSHSPASLDFIHWKRENLRLLSVKGSIQNYSFADG